jgi:hypothetical protein
MQGDVQNCDINKGYDDDVTNNPRCIVQQRALAGKSMGIDMRSVEEVRKLYEPVQEQAYTDN